MRKLFLFVLPIIFIFFIINPPNALAVSETFKGQTQTGSTGQFDYDFGANICDKITDPEVTTTDLRPCVDALGSYQNTCCTSSSCTAADGSTLSLWQYNYASGCTATAIGGGFCSVKFKYQTQSCPATDTCRNEPYLYPGLCTQNGCAISGTRYKVCCNSNGTVNGNCSGGDYTGTCTSDYNVVCGISSCAGVAGNCTTKPCGEAACKEFSKATPTPAPIGCKTDDASAVGCEVRCKFVNGVKMKCHIYNRNLQNVCDTKCPGAWNCVRDEKVCPNIAGTPTPTPCSGPNCCFTPGATRQDCRQQNVCSL